MTYQPRPAKRANKSCPRCGRLDPSCGFGLNRYRKDGLAEHCADCKLARSRADQAARKARKPTSHQHDDGERYHALPLENLGRFPCGAKDCDMSFSSAEVLECHRWMRHGL